MAPLLTMTQFTYKLKPNEEMMAQKRSFCSALNRHYKCYFRLARHSGEIREIWDVETPDVVTITPFPGNYENASCTRSRLSFQVDCPQLALISVKGGG
jgi:hypothetical protein